jgi:hypothetical protein
MAGLHFSCGEWLGDDKSADPFFDIIPKGLSPFVLEEEKAAWCDEFLVPLRRQARAHQVKLKPEMMRAIVEPLRRYRDALAEKLGLASPDAPLEELFPGRHVPSDDELKFCCVRDLLAGNEVCQQTGKPIFICFA